MDNMTNMDQTEQTTVDPAKLKQIIFNGKPKRIYKASRNADMTFQDPKRVHTALREFNDLSANAVFKGIIEQIQQIENEKSSGGLGLNKRRHTVAPQSLNQDLMTGSQASSLPKTSGVSGAMGDLGSGASF